MKEQGNTTIFTNDSAERFNKIGLKRNFISPTIISDGNFK